MLGDCGKSTRFCEKRILTRYQLAADHMSTGLYVNVSSDRSLSFVNTALRQFLQ